MRLPETDEIAAELYLVPPARFVAARDQLVRQARAAGHRELARELQALRRPTLSAWLVNALARHQRARLQELFAVGRELRRAQTRLDAELLRRLPGEREELVAELLDWVRRHAAEAGVHPTEAALAEVQSTLQAGLVDLAAAAAVMSGHLARPMEHAGFGPLPQVSAAAGPSAPASGPMPDPRPAEDDAAGWPMWPVDDELGRRREKAAAVAADRPDGPAEVPYAGPGWTRERVPARDPAETLRRAEAELAEAASAHWQREHDLAEAEAAMQVVQDRQELIEQQRMQLRREKVSAEQDLAAARAAQRAALRTLVAARRTLEEAEERLRSGIDSPDRS
ncbi:MAG TPA: hypothetical protein VI357_26655 [Mycobacteriales bacterium]